MKNSQVNAILERLHVIIAHVLCTSEFDMSEAVTQEMIDYFFLVLPGLFAQPTTWC